MIVETQSVRFDSISLDNGATLAPLDVAYESYGELNKAKSNAILILHAFSGDAHAAGISAETGKPGWWDNMIGPSKAFDTGKYFIICANVLGGCQGTTGPSSVDPQTGKPYGLKFPFLTVGDFVQVHSALVKHLGIEKLLAVVGGSLGGMQVLEWAARYPDQIRSAVCLASAARLTAQGIAFNCVGR